MRIDAQTIMCATIARPNRAARSPVMHNAGFEALGLKYVYLAFEPEAHMLAKAVDGLRALGARGFSVSQPYKQAVVPLLDELDETAAEIGAVNTVYNDNGRLKGYNTDWIGALRAVEEKTDPAGRRVCLIGAGGAARAIAFGFRKRGALVAVWSRDKAKGSALARDAAVDFGGVLTDLPRAVNEYDIVINATPAGMGAQIDVAPVPGSALKPGTIVLDAVFVPCSTRLLREAAAAGCVCVDGATMLLYQGLFQFELFTGKKPPVEAMRAALYASLD
ncbi:MAG: shikimate dehydrogenase [Treponemataceae bacterium]